MTFVVRPSRPGSVVAAAYALKAQAERADKKAGKAKPKAEPVPVKNAAPKKKGKR